MLETILDAAQAYRGVIPGDCWHVPYMSLAELESEIGDGVRFWGWEESGRIVGVMGIQDRGEVWLIRHAYVQTAFRRRGIGSALLERLKPLAEAPLLVGTWAAAVWAVSFYEKHGFTLVTPIEKNRLLKTYWAIPDRQIETSVVLADDAWFRMNGRMNGNGETPA